MDSKHHAVLQFWKQGFPVVWIAKHIGLTRQGVYSILKRFQVTGTVLSQPRSGRPISEKSKRALKVAKSRIKRNPRRSGRKMAKDLGVSQRTMVRILKNDLKVHAFKLQKAHYLTDKMKATRKEKCTELRSWLEGET